MTISPSSTPKSVMKGLFRSRTSKSTSLKTGRPPLLLNTTSSLPKSHPNPKSKATRTLIRAHHNLHKSRAKALREGNSTLVALLDEQINELGGLPAYQVASLTGQSKERGGDSSILLVRWLEEGGILSKSRRTKGNAEATQGVKVLEIGALSSKNAISSFIGRGIETVKRIDLKSQEPGEIEEVDFMNFPIPLAEESRFDIISLSLVLNYVPDAHGRGQMLKRTRSFLRHHRRNDQNVNETITNTIPCLFVVLPLPCIENSRYMTATRFQEMMTSLGYTSIRVHQSTKLHYELFRLDNLNSQEKQDKVFKKVEVHPGKGRNNFCIILGRDDGDG